MGRRSPLLWYPERDTYPHDHITLPVLWHLGKKTSQKQRLVSRHDLESTSEKAALLKGIPGEGKACAPGSQRHLAWLFHGIHHTHPCNCLLPSPSPLLPLSASASPSPQLGAACFS